MPFTKSDLCEVSSLGSMFCSPCWCHCCWFVGLFGLWCHGCSCNSTVMCPPCTAALCVSKNSKSLRSWVQYKQTLGLVLLCIFWDWRVCQIVTTWSFPCCPILCLAFLQNIQEMKMTMKLCPRPLQVAGVLLLLFYFVFKPRHCFISHTA